MESLIPFIIMLLLGSLFSGGKRKSSTEEQKQQKPFTAQPKKQESPMGKLKEMSRDLYKEIQTEIEQSSNSEKRSKQSPAPAPERTVAQVEISKPEEQVRRPSSQNRGQRREQQSKQVQRHNKTKSKRADQDLIPRNSDDLMKGVIFSEILGPPKSRR